MQRHRGGGNVIRDRPAVEEPAADGLFGVAGLAVHAGKRDPVALPVESMGRNTVVESNIEDVRRLFEFVLGRPDREVAHWRVGLSPAGELNVDLVRRIWPHVARRVVEQPQHNIRVELIEPADRLKIVGTEMQSLGGGHLSASPLAVAQRDRQMQPALVIDPHVAPIPHVRSGAHVRAMFGGPFQTSELQRRRFRRAGSYQEVSCEKSPHQRHQDYQSAACSARNVYHETSLRSGKIDEDDARRVADWCVMVSEMITERMGVEQYGQGRREGFDGRLPRSVCEQKDRVWFGAARREMGSGTYFPAKSEECVRYRPKELAQAAAHK